jgi:hypothetical protein
MAAAVLALVSALDGASGPSGDELAPAPDFRYVGLEPIVAPRLGIAATAFGLGTGVTLAVSSIDAAHALLAGAIASIMSAFALRGAASSTVTTGSVRMAIVPWGVLVEVHDTPRILRWAAVRTIEIQTSRAHRLIFGPSLSTSVEITTERDRFVGAAVGIVPLERLVEHVEDYAAEQAAPIALALGDEAAASEGVEVVEPGFEMVLAAARDWLSSAAGTVSLGLESACYRKTSSRGATPRAVEVLRRVLRDRTPRRPDRRAFAAVVAAELGATALVPDLIALAQCPHVLVAAAARQAARRLGAPRAKTGTLDELAPFLFDADRERLETWGNDFLAGAESRMR